MIKLGNCTKLRIMQSSLRDWDNTNTFFIVMSVLAQSDTTVETKTALHVL